MYFIPEIRDIRPHINLTYHSDGLSAQAGGPELILVFGVDGRVRVVYKFTWTLGKACLAASMRSSEIMC